MEKNSNIVRPSHALQSRMVGLRFRQQISYGIGASMVFGLVGALAHALIPLVQFTAITSVAAALPLLGMITLGTVGIGCIYMSAKFMSENTMLEQDSQAKKIAIEARSNAPAQNIPTKTDNFPSQAAELDVAESNRPATTIMQVAQQGRAASNDNLMTDRVRA